MGIEPTPSAWKAEVLPLNYTRQVKPPGATHCDTAGLQTCPFIFPYPLHQVGGGGRIRTYEGVASRFTVCPR